MPSAQVRAQQHPRGLQVLQMHLLSLLLLLLWLLFQIRLVPACCEVQQAWLCPPAAAAAPVAARALP